LHRDLWQFFKMTRRDRCSLPVFQVQIDDEIAMDAVSGQSNEHTQITNRPDNVSEASLHGSSKAPNVFRGKADMMPLSPCASIQKSYFCLCKSSPHCVGTQHLPSIFVIERASGLAKSLIGLKRCDFFVWIRLTRSFRPSFRSRHSPLLEAASRVTVMGQFSQPAGIS